VDQLAEPDSGSVSDPGAQPVEESRARAKNRSSRAFRWIIEVAVIVAAAFVLAFLVQQFLVKPYVIPSPSMEPTLMEGDRVLVNRLVYHFHAPHRGDVIVFHPPGRPGSDPFIKRVVAVGGDTVAVHDGLLYLNGEPQAEPFIMEHPILNEFAQVAVPEGYVWVMGDNRNDSGDSRVFGPVSVKAIVGEAFAVYWPIRRFKGL
jgi:signal peptidase I